MKDLAALLLPAEHRLQFLEEVKGVLSPEQFEREIGRASCRERV